MEQKQKEEEREHLVRLEEGLERKLINQRRRIQELELEYASQKAQDKEELKTLLRQILEQRAEIVQILGLSLLTRIRESLDELRAEIRIHLNHKFEREAWKRYREPSRDP